MRYLFLIIVLVGVMPACSQRQTYEMIQQNRKAECEKMIEGQRQNCLQGYEMSYEEYLQQRQK